MLEIIFDSLVNHATGLSPNLSTARESARSSAARTRTVELEEEVLVNRMWISVLPTEHTQTK